MKLCVLNLSCNVGKSTLAVHLLAAFAAAPRIISVESINASNVDDVDKVEVESLGASRFKEIFREILLHDDLIVDVGASNVATFMAEMTRFKSAVGEFDLVLVPTVPADKPQRDTIATVEWLHTLGLDGRRVRVLFNQYPTESLEPLNLVYAQVLGFAATDGRGKAVFEPHAVIAHNDAFEMAKASRQTMRELAADATDWKAARREAKLSGDLVALEDAMAGQMLHDLAVTAQENLTQVHALLFSPSSPSPGAMRVRRG